MIFSTYNWGTSRTCTVYYFSPNVLCFTSGGFVPNCSPCFFSAELPTQPAAIFASPPSGTYEEALGHFQLAEGISPGFYIRNRLMIAKCQQRTTLTQLRGRARFHIAPHDRPTAHVLSASLSLSRARARSLSLLDAKPFPQDDAALHFRTLTLPL